MIRDGAILFCYFLPENSVTFIGKFLVIFAWLSVYKVQAEQVHIAVASNFINPMKEIIQVFEQQSKHKVIVSYGSSGKMYAQIYHGAPYQVFFSADQAKAIALEKGNLAVKGSRFTYAMGGLVLWSSRDNYFDKELTVLKNNQFTKLALANYKLAPYGIAAKQVLTYMGLAKQTQTKWVQGENIAQTYQFIESGNADLGFIARSQYFQQIKQQQKKGSYWQVPNNLHQAIAQDVVLLNKGQESNGAQALLAFIKTNTAQEIILSYGYQSSVTANE